jgi:hypothetical protein
LRPLTRADCRNVTPSPGGICEIDQLVSSPVVHPNPCRALPRVCALHRRFHAPRCIDRQSFAVPTYSIQQFRAIRVGDGGRLGWAAWVGCLWTSVVGFVECLVCFCGAVGRRCEQPDAGENWRQKVGCFPCGWSLLGGRTALTRSFGSAGTDEDPAPCRAGRPTRSPPVTRLTGLGKHPGGRNRHGPSNRRPADSYFAGLHLCRLQPRLRGCGGVAATGTSAPEAVASTAAPKATSVAPCVVAQRWGATLCGRSRETRGLGPCLRGTVRDCPALGRNLLRTQQADSRVDSCVR